MRFLDRVVWITGASSGIGEALAKGFAREGAKLVLSSRRRSELERVQRDTGIPAEKIFVLPLDVSDHGKLEKAAAQVKKRFGGVDVLVNNAGLTQRALASETDLKTSKYIFDVDFFGAVAMTSAVKPLMGPGGRIVVISSVAGKVGTPYRSSYCAAKHALHGYFDSLRAELWNEKIGVTMILPGYVRTEISKNAMAPGGKKHGKMDPGVHGGVSADEFAGMALTAIHEGKREALLSRGKERFAVLLARYAPSILARIVRTAKVT